MRHGWFVIPGVQTGDRTLEEQRLGLEKALAACKGKSVLDVGCAEGLIAREFAMRGAVVVGVDSLLAHLEVAEIMCRGHLVTLRQGNLKRLESMPGERFDIVLALGVLQKAHEPLTALRYVANASQDLLLVRLSDASANGVVRSKFTGHVCDVPAEMRHAGFALECVEGGPRNERTYYWRR